MYAFYNKLLLPTSSDIYVFWTDIDARHTHVSAMVAKRFYGAIDGFAGALVNQSYGIPIFDSNLSQLPIEHLVPNIHQFVQFTNSNRHLTFYIDNNIDATLGSYFQGAINCRFHNSFERYLRFLI